MHLLQAQEAQTAAAAAAAAKATRTTSASASPPPSHFASRCHSDSRHLSAGTEALEAQVAAATANAARGHEDSKCRGNTWPFLKLRVDMRPLSDF